MENTAKNELKREGYFFHPGGDLPGTLNMRKKRGVWRKVDSPVEAVYIGQSWEEASEYEYAKKTT